MRKVLKIAAVVAVLSALAACGSVRTTAVPGPTVTVANDVTEPVPGPTVTVTAKPPVLLSKTYSGSGQWNSPAFTLSCDQPVVTVKYSYWGNTLDGMGSNFIADIESGSDQQSIVNDIGASGGATTTLYPDPTFSGSNRYHLSVTADGSWRFTLSETC